MNGSRTDISQFKNDNRANSDLVIEHMLGEMEKHIWQMTGKKVKLTAKEMKS